MKSESHRVEFKRELTASLEKEVVAFLNDHEGGVIYIGVDDNGNSVGVKDIDSTQLTIKNRIRDGIQPSTMGLFDISTEQLDSVNILKITIASGSEKPYYIRKFGMSPKGCFVRIGSASDPMTETQIESLFGKRTRNSIGKIESRYQDLTFEQLKIYYETRKLPLNDKFARNLELLAESGKYNYAAYLLSDENGCSIKVAKYRDTTRVDLIENEEYGYCSLIKATKAVLDKLHIENRTLTKITPMERQEHKLVDPTALREAVINAIIHNNYVSENPPKFEIFSNRIEITSTGGLPEDLSREDFFAGYSKPRNKELMRVYRDLDMVEHLGSGIPRILEEYDESAFVISDNFIRIVFHFNIEEPKPKTGQVNTEVNTEVRKLLLVCKSVHSKRELKVALKLKNDEYFRKKYLKPALTLGLIEMTIPEKPKSRLQKYRLTEKGSKVRGKLKGDSGELDG